MASRPKQRKKDIRELSIENHDLLQSDISAWPMDIDETFEVNSVMPTREKRVS
jgi:hypothetical protein